MTEREPRLRGVPADPSGIEEPHDVLAADEFVIGTRDERLPPDPAGTQEPHDVLAAEEFAMPAGGVESRDDRSGGRDLRAFIPLLLLMAALAAVVLLRRRD